MNNFGRIFKTSSIIAPLVIFFGGILQAQQINIPDASFVTLKSNTRMYVPCDIVLGGGTSGRLVMDGTSLECDGVFTLGAGAEFTHASGTVDFASSVYHENSTVAYTGVDQTVPNHNFGNLVFGGTGTMQISGTNESWTSCNNLTVNNTGNKLKIAENKAITISGTVTNNAGNSGIEVASSESGDGSLILSTANVDATVKRLCKGSQWHYLTAPISDAPSDLFPAGYFMNWDATMEWGGLGDWNPWKTYSAQDLVPGAGYAYYSSGDVLSFEGKLNVSDYTQTLRTSATGTAANQGWNMVGNPFTSAIDWDVAVTDGAVPVGAENAIYFFDDSNGTGEQSNYKYYVPSSGGTYGVGTEDATKNIPAGQGFFIKTNTDNVDLYLKADYRLHNAQTFYKKAPEGVIRLEASRNGKTDEMLIRIAPDATLNFDADLDARKLFTSNTAYPQVFSISEDAQNFMAINSIPEIDRTLKIPVGFSAVSGDYLFFITELNMDMDIDGLFLVDVFLKLEIPLEVGTVYNFTHEEGDSEDRFYLKFMKTVTDIEQGNSKSNLASIYPNPAHNQIYIEDLSQNTSVLITDVSGKIMLNEVVENESIKSYNIENYANGIYFVKIASENDTQIFKIIKN